MLAVIKILFETFLSLKQRKEFSSGTGNGRCLTADNDQPLDSCHTTQKVEVLQLPYCCHQQQPGCKKAGICSVMGLDGPTCWNVMVSWGQ